MFERILNKSEKMLKFFVKVQCFFSFVIAIVVFGMIFNVLARVSTFAAFVLSTVIAVFVWFMMMSSAWVMYAFADLVECTKEYREEISGMSAGLAEYTKATNQTFNGMSKDLFFIARHFYADEENAKSAAEKTQEKDENEGD